MADSGLNLSVKMGASNQARLLPEGASPVSGVVPPPEHRFKPGQSGNPSGRPVVARSPSKALAEINDTEGATPDEIVRNFTAKRGKLMCGADHKAIAMFRAACDPEKRTHVSAFEASTDRLEGKVTQPVAQTGSVRFEFGAVPNHPALEDGEE